MADEGTPPTALPVCSNGDGYFKTALMNANGGFTKRRLPAGNDHKASRMPALLGAVAFGFQDFFGDGRFERRVEIAEYFRVTRGRVREAVVSSLVGLVGARGAFVEIRGEPSPRRLGPPTPNPTSKLANAQILNVSQFSLRFGFEAVHLPPKLGYRGNGNGRSRSALTNLSAATGSTGGSK